MTKTFKAFAAGLALSASLFTITATAQADPNKVLRASFPVAETGFDPQAVNDIYSNYVNRALFEPLYVYDPIARPYKITPNTAASLPEISPDGLTWTIKIKPGIYFIDDPVFKGQKRELTAADYVYSWKRVLDPKMRSPVLQTFDGLFVGADKLIAKAKETGKFDHDIPLEGLQAIDRYTLRIKLVKPAYDLQDNLTSATSSAVAREVIEAYGDASGWAMANPVGTGAYRLAQWRRGQKIVLEANPNFREEYFPDDGEPADRALVAAMKGKRLPQAGRVGIISRRVTSSESERGTGAQLSGPRPQPRAPVGGQGLRARRRVRGAGHATGQRRLGPVGAGRRCSGRDVGDRPGR